MALSAFLFGLFEFFEVAAQALSATARNIFLGRLCACTGVFESLTS